MLAGLASDVRAALRYTWPFWARPSQLEPEGRWRIWILCGGRGSGKTRTGAETVIARVRSGRAQRVGLVGRTAADVRDVMVGGESGILACSPPWFYPAYEPSKRLLTWPNGAQAHTYSADEPRHLRGPAHDFVWADELAAWRRVDPMENPVFNMLAGLRLGSDPRAVVTTTPKKNPLYLELLKHKSAVITRMRTDENLTNLAEAFIEEVVGQYRGTRVGRQELDAELLMDVPGALWTMELIERYRVFKTPEFERLVVAIDPGVTVGEEAALTGVVVAARGTDGQFYVLEDLSLKAKPAGWGSAALAALAKYRGDRIVGEVNQGGDMVEHVIHTLDPSAPFKAVTATRGKQTRAEPISALYEQGKVHHVGSFPELEDQMTSWVPGEKSPDRMDALVWALTELRKQTGLKMW